MSTKVERPIKNFLVDFGLTDKEITIYLTLLKTGPNTIMNLARETNIKRSTTHNTVEELIKKGLVSQTNYGERRMVVAEDPEKLEFLLEQKRWDMKKLEDNLPEIVKGIYEMVPAAKENSSVEVKYYDGERGVRSVYEEALSANELRSYVNMNKVATVFPDNANLFVDGLNKNKRLKIWEIVEVSDTSALLIQEFSKNERYQYKFTTVPLELDSADVLIYDGKVGIVNAAEKKTAMVITNFEYYNNSKAIFDFVWKMMPQELKP